MHDEVRQIVMTKPDHIDAVYRRNCIDILDAFTVATSAITNVRFALDFSQKLATIRSPFQFVDVIVEFTKRRADMLGKQSTEMAALTRR